MLRADRQLANAVDVDEAIETRLSDSPDRAPRLRVLMFPKYGDNPYLFRLWESLERRGLRVDDFSFELALSERYDVLHIHWPDLHLQARSSLRGCL